MRKPTRRIRSLSFAPIAVAVGAMATLLIPGVANAGPSVGVSLGLAAPTQDHVKAGVDAGIFAGARIELPLLWITPEVSFHTSKFNYDVDGLSTSAQRLLGGVRVHVGALIKPGAYAHIGYGWLKTTNFETNSGVSWDGGLLLDFAALPFLDFGLHGGYSSTKQSTTTVNVGSGTTLSSGVSLNDANWFDIGAHASLTF